jgi:hypothetical protein
MERRIKIFILLLAFFLDLWVWNTYADTLGKMIVFIVVFLAAPLIWGLVMDVRDGVGEPPDGRLPLIYSLRKKAPQIAGIIMSILIIISKVLPLLEVDVIWASIVEIIVSLSLFGFLWNLGIRDLEIGER